MKKLILILLIITLGCNLIAQSKKGLIETRQNIQNQITFLTLQLDSINKLITDLEIKELDSKSLKLNCIVAKNTYLSSKPDFSGEKIIDVVVNDTVVLIDIVQSGYLYVTFHGQKGYLLKNEIQNTPEFQKIDNIKKAIYETSSLKQIEDSRLCDSIKLDSLRKQTLQQEIIFKNKCIKKFGKELGTIIAQKKVRIGMTAEMCEWSWGRPSEINKTTVTWGVHEQWIYGEDNYLYFENGILTTIQN